MRHADTRENHPCTKRRIDTKGAILLRFCVLGVAIHIQENRMYAYSYHVSIPAFRNGDIFETLVIQVCPPFLAHIWKER
jgi:hypothetical protein